MSPAVGMKTHEDAGDEAEACDGCVMIAPGSMFTQNWAPAGRGGDRLPAVCLHTNLQADMNDMNQRWGRHAQPMSHKMSLKPRHISKALKAPLRKEAVRTGLGTAQFVDIELTLLAVGASRSERTHVAPMSETLDRKLRSTSANVPRTLHMNLGGLHDASSPRRPGKSCPQSASAQSSR